MPSLSRRKLLKQLGVASVAAAAAPLAAAAASETYVAQLYSTLTAQQRNQIAFPFDHPLRSRVENNWHITEARVGRSFTAEQQELIRDIFVGLHNPQFLDKSLERLDHDSGGLANCSAAIFGEPGSDAFEFVLTARHLTARCDGDSVAGAAFGGPIFYGHQGRKFYEDAGHPDNIYWYQAQRANALFQALDGKQRDMALLGDARPENGVGTVALKRAGEKGEGLPVSAMSADQRKLVLATVDDLLLPFREQDRAECLRLIDDNGGVESLAMAFYKNQDIGGDGVWDVWQLESPSMIWHFRGAPHIHVWVNVQENPGWSAPAPAA